MKWFQFWWEIREESSIRYFWKISKNLEFEIRKKKNNIQIWNELVALDMFAYYLIAIVYYLLLFAYTSRSCKWTKLYRRTSKMLIFYAVILADRKYLISAIDFEAMKIMKEIVNHFFFFAIHETLLLVLKFMHLNSFFFNGKSGSLFFFSIFNLICINRKDSNAWIMKFLQILLYILSK